MSDLIAHIKPLASNKNAHYFIACSGGVDSMVLLDLVRRAKLQCSVLHVNYHLRGEDANQDEQLIQAYCKQHSIPFEVRSVELAEQLEQGGNLQELARKYRYDWFLEKLNASANNYILMAHHRDDQVETFFQNLARNAGVMGLAAMPKENNRIVRPLLDVSKASIYAYAEQNAVPWREDASNQSNKYTRNKLRNVILPTLRKALPSIDDSVLLLVDQFQRKQLELERKVLPYLATILEKHTLLITDYHTLDEFERIELFRQLGQTASRAAELDKILSAQKGKRIQLSVNDACPFAYIVKEAQHLSFVKEETVSAELLVEVVDTLPAKFDKNSVYLNKAKVHGDLRVRPWKIGDRMSPIGLDGSQLISDIIADAKIPASQKSSVMVVHDEQEIHWCVGLKVGRKAIAQPNDTVILKCAVNCYTTN